MEIKMWCSAARDLKIGAQVNGQTHVSEYCVSDIDFAPDCQEARVTITDKHGARFVGSVNWHRGHNTCFRAVVKVSS